MAITEAYANSATIGTTPYSLPNNSTTPATITDDGVYQVFLDLNALTITETYRIQVLERVRSAGTQRVVYEQIVAGPGVPILVFPSLVLLHGWDVLVTKLAGTDRAIEWSIRKVA